ncbi:hypothetical protein GOODEAATRI_017038 [Goodea atripinnis]|uniref:Uncharacterized protein n=1 Tax=Goodea atripinnis TaxID=208336 RepID=A0ABV0NKX1_9TELE
MLPKRFWVSLTVHLLDGQPVVQFQFELGSISNGSLVIWPHDGRIRGGMREAKSMAELMHRYCPDLMVIKMCVTRDFIHARKEGMGQGATAPIERVAIIMKQAVKRHSDVPFS